MDKYTTMVEVMKDDELIKTPNLNDKANKLFAILAWFGGISAALGLLAAFGIDEIFYFFTFAGALLLAMCTPLAISCKKMSQASMEEIRKRGIEGQLEHARWQQAQKNKENKTYALCLLAVFIVVALIFFGIRGCTGGSYTRCPKCGSLYDAGTGGANYIEKYGKCSKCDYDDSFNTDFFD